LRFYGRISYSFYLLHPLILMVAWNQPDLLGQFIRAEFPPALLAAIMFGISVLLVTPLAMLSYRFIELPSMRAMKWLRSGRPLAMSRVSA
jgi:peptidoglycan/LPS O-acetylase OafA/YrhL